MKPVTKTATPAWIALLLMPTGLLAAETVTHIPPDATTTDLQVLSAPAAEDVHRLWNQGSLREPGGMDSAVIIEGSGEGRIVVDNESLIGGRVDFSGVSGGVTFNNQAGATWQAYAPTSGVLMHFSGGDDLLSNAEGGTVSIGKDFFAEPMTVDFGAGIDVIENEGIMTMAVRLEGLEVVRNSERFWIHSIEGVQELTNSGDMRIQEYAIFENANRIENSGVLTLGEYNITTGESAYVDATGLSRFDNSGTINLVSPIPVFTNRLIIDGADFVAAAGSRLELEVYFADAGQDGCALSATGVADCVSIRGGSTSGVTSIWLDASTADKGAAFLEEGIVLVDVRGGESEAGHFVLDPTTPGFEADAPLGGGIRADEMFTFHLLFDEATQTHRLMGIPDLQTQVLVAVPTIAQSLWRTAESSSVARQFELRTRKAGGGLWFKASDGHAERDDGRVGFKILGHRVDTPLSYEQDDRAYSFGLDMTRGDEGASRYSLGVSFGEVTSEFSINDLGTRAEIEALSFAVYGSYQRGGFFFDLSGSGYLGDMDGTLALQANDYVMEATVDAVGGRAETGYRLPFGDAFAIEPLLSVVYVQAGIGSVQHLPGNKNNAVSFETATSLRGGAGARAEFGLDLASLKLSFSLAARAWEEFKGETEANVRTIRDPFPFASQMDGRFTEVDAAVGLGTANGMFSGYFAFGGQFGDDYDSTTASLGVRYNW